MHPTSAILPLRRQRPGNIDDLNVAPTSRAEIQEPYVRETQIDPDLYYPEGFKPELLEEWPVDGDLVVPMEMLPENLRNSMGSAWRHKQEYLELRGE